MILPNDFLFGARIHELSSTSQFSTLFLYVVGSNVCLADIDVIVLTVSSICDMPLYTFDIGSILHNLAKYTTSKRLLFALHGLYCI